MAVFRDMADAEDALLADGGFGNVLPEEGDFAADKRLKTGETVDKL